MKIFGRCVVLVTLSLALLFLHVIGSTAWPTRQDGTQTPSLSPMSSSRSGLHSIDTLPEQGLAPYKASAGSIHKRMMPNFPGNTGQVYRVKFTSFGLITPLAIAARALEEFYVEVAVKASTIWATLPQRQAMNLQLGHFRLNFLCVGDTIPWTFVKKIADNLWEAACRQLTDLFEVIYMDSSQKIAVKVWLEIVEHSSGESNDGVREGSVPSVTSP